VVASDGQNKTIDAAGARIIQDFSLAASVRQLALPPDKAINEWFWLEFCTELPLSMVEFRDESERK
jgi:hypothetical protein